MIELVPAEQSHIAPIAERMREWDRIEAQAMGHSPAVALKLGIAASVDCFTVMIDDEPQGIIGMVPKNVLEGEGCPWMLGTDELYRHPRGMIVLSRRMVERWRFTLPHLCNYVAAENVKAIRYLRRLGFTVSEERISVNGVDFVRFAMGEETSDL